ncbi:formin-like protein 20 [Nilaparvata lugens]|uniref:formin-like protein 20 n=1 Tax=Nilaparvata lugens TaxID=108931 RepID=UPI00193E1677|nr:formin-like protein 20 [Nilaparvata lugens]
MSRLTQNNPGVGPFVSQLLISPPPPVTPPPQPVTPPPPPVIQPPPTNHPTATSPHHHRQSPHYYHQSSSRRQSSHRPRPRRLQFGSSPSSHQSASPQDPIIQTSTRNRVIPRVPTPPTPLENWVLANLEENLRNWGLLNSGQNQTPTPASPSQELESLAGLSFYPEDDPPPPYNPEWGVAFRDRQQQAGSPPPAEEVLDYEMDEEDRCKTLRVLTALSVVQPIPLPMVQPLALPVGQHPQIKSLLMERT